MNQTNQTDKTIQRILALLNREFRKQNRKQFTIALFSAFSVCFIVFGILFFIENIFYLSAAIKSTAVVFTVLISFVAAISIFMKSHSPLFDNFCEMVLLSYNYEEILNAIDLYQNRGNDPSAFREYAIRENIKKLETEKLSQDISQFGTSTPIHKTYQKSLYAFLGSFLFWGLMMVSYPDDALRTAYFWESYSQPNPYNFTISPADTTIELGSGVDISVYFNGEEIPRQATLLFKTEIEDEFRRRNMSKADSSLFVSPQIDLNNTITYQIEMDGFRSDTYEIDVKIQPAFEELAVSIHPPGYTSLPPDNFTYPYPELNIYEGSEITFSGKTNKEVQSVFLTGMTADTLLLESDAHGIQHSISFRPETSDTLGFRLIDEDRLSNRNPFKTFINLRKDRYPVVTIREPDQTIREPEPEQVTIFYEANDDFGISRAELKWELRRAFTDNPQTGTVPVQTPRNGPTEQINWPLDEFDLRPRDELAFKIRVWDNDEYNGFKYSDSGEMMIQIPSLAEYFDELEDRERDVETELDEISEQFNMMESEYDEFLERLRQNPEAGYEEEEQLQQIRERQEQIENSVQNLNERFNEVRSEIEQNDRVSDETKRSYRELQQLMDELDDPALREAMEELQRALESLNPQDLEQALEDVSFNEQLYKERIERTLELFKQLKMNSDLDKLANQYEDMAERMKQAGEESVDENERNNELNNISEDLNSTENQIEDLDRNPPRRNEERLRQLKEEAKQGLENIRNEMDELEGKTESSDNSGENDEGSEQQSDPGEKSDQRQQQQKIGEMMQQEAQRFRSSVQQMNGQQINVNILALQRALYTLLELSNQQEQITQTTNQTRNRSQGFVELARIQKNISDQFSAVSDTLFKVSSELPGVPNQINRLKLDVERVLSRSMEEMVERNQRQASIATRESLGGINDLSSMLASLIDQLMNQQGGGMGSGMSMQQMVEQLQNMSGDQQQLNQQLQNLINDMQGDRLSREQSERLDQIARQQNEIRKQLQQLQQSGALDHGDRVLSELERMMEDMEESINDMRGGITDPLMVQRQQNILSRMLNAEESLQQRGEDDEREGTASDEYDRSLPPEITLEELEQEIRDRLQDPNYTRFSEEYRRLIERYFEQLRRLESQPLP